MKTIFIAAILILAAVGGGYWYWQSQSAGMTTFRFAEVKRGRLVATVGSTGSLQAREQVDIGAQVAGAIIYIGKDPNTKSGIVDWCSEVKGPESDDKGNVIKKGTILAQIDPALYTAQANSAEASVKAAKADLIQKTATLNQATSDWKRAQDLFATKGVAQAEYDNMKAVFEVAQANVEVSKANIGVAEANLKMAQTNLNYTTITSPVDGMVVDRRVNVGQTVVASLSAPSLFLIAKDLRQMEVWATVNEVDVLKIKVGQKVKFTVDANPGKTYQGTVVPQGKLPFRMNALMNSNVVTYTVVVSADNEDLILRPYLTANLSFILADVKDALLVPNAALRWQPAKQQIAPDVRDAYASAKAKKRLPVDGEIQEHGFVWVNGEKGFVRFIEVVTGWSDNLNTEILSVANGAELRAKTEKDAGTLLIVGEGKPEAAPAAGANPFLATPFSTKKKDQ
jgi:HlyD family secretion protein